MLKNKKWWHSLCNAEMNLFKIDYLGINNQDNVPTNKQILAMYLKYEYKENYFFQICLVGVFLLLIFG